MPVSLGLDWSFLVLGLADYLETVQISWRVNCLAKCSFNDIKQQSLNQACDVFGRRGLKHSRGPRLLLCAELAFARGSNRCSTEKSFEGIFFRTLEKLEEGLAANDVEASDSTVERAEA